MDYYMKKLSPENSEDKIQSCILFERIQALTELVFSWKEDNKQIHKARELISANEEKQNSVIDTEEGRCYLRQGH